MFWKFNKSINLKGICVALFITLLIFLAITYKWKERPFDIEPETLEKAEKFGFDYASYIDKALQRDKAAMAYLLAFSWHFDTASANGHNDALYQIMDHVGERFVVEVLDTMPDEVKRTLRTGRADPEAVAKYPLFFRSINYKE